MSRIIASRLAGLNVGVAGIHQVLFDMQQGMSQRSAPQTQSPQAPTFGVGFATRTLGKLSDPISQSLYREFERLVNAHGPTAMPGVEELIHLYYTGLMSPFPNPRAKLAEFALGYGIDFRGRTSYWHVNNERRILWNQILESKKPRYPASFLRKLYRQGVPNIEDELRQTLAVEGFPLAYQQAMFLDEWESIDVGTIITLWRMSAITQPRARELLTIIGFRRIEEQNALFQAAEVRYDPTTAISLWMTGLAGETAVDDAFRMAGWQNQAQVDNVKRLRFASPSLSDVLAQGNMVAAGPAVNRFRTNLSAVPDWYKKWAGRVGGNMSVDADVDYGTENADNSWALQAWANQWQLPDVGMLAQFLHRFRGEPNDPSTWAVPGVQPLTYDEASALLTANGIADSLKPYVFNLMYAPLNLRHIQLIVRHMPVTVPQIALWLQDNGISPQQSTILAQTYAAKRQEEIDRPVVQQREKALAKLYRSVESAYETGTLSHNDATTELTANGMDGAAAITTLAAIDVQVANRLTEEVIKRARTDVFAGIIPIGAIGPRLVQAGIAAPRVTQIVATWAAQLTAGIKTLGTSKILRYLRKGYITRDQALVRLTNLGWTGADLLLLLHEVQAEIAADTAKTIAAGEREKAQQERAIEKQLGKTAHLANALQSRLKVLTPPAKLVKWYKDGVWSEAKVRGRLRLIGYTDDVIDAMLLDALHTTPKAAKKTVAKP